MDQLFQKVFRSSKTQHIKQSQEDFKVRAKVKLLESRQLRNVVFNPERTRFHIITEDNSILYNKIESDQLIKQGDFKAQTKIEASDYAYNSGIIVIGDNTS